MNGYFDEEAVMSMFCAVNAGKRLVERDHPQMTETMERWEMIAARLKRCMDNGYILVAIDPSVGKTPT